MSNMHNSSELMCFKLYNNYYYTHVQGNLYYEIYNIEKYTLQKLPFKP